VEFLKSKDGEDGGEGNDEADNKTGSYFKYLHLCKPKHE
jgi:hypothetical protein